MVSENYFWPVFRRDRKIHGQFYKCKEVDLKAKCSGSHPVGCIPFGAERFFHRGHLRKLENTDIYVTINNKGKFTVMK